MNLYIQIKDGSPINHPALMDNIIQAFGEIPSDWQPFIRVQQPEIGIYQVLNSQEPTYQFVESTGYWMDVWDVRDMTEEEKAAKQQAAKDRWAQRPNLNNLSAWTFDEDTCTYIPPIPRPDDGKIYRWDGASNTWIEYTPPITNPT
jgi:hypothetical protein